MSFKPNQLQYSNYFLTNVIKKRTYLNEEMIQNVLIHHEFKVVQKNKRNSYFGYIFSHKKYLRVITEDDIVFNAYFDRGFKGKFK